MNKFLVIGANGKIGRQLVALSHRQGLPVRAMVRSESQAEDLQRRGIDAVVADLEGDFSSAVRGCDQVIFTAGSGAATGPDKTLLIDLYGAMRAVDVAREQGVRRFIMVSALRADDPERAPAALRPYLAAKIAADHYLRTSSLPYLILRPGLLTDEEPSGRISLAYSNPDEAVTARAHCAEMLLKLVTEPDIVNLDISLIDGDETFESALMDLRRKI